MVVVIVVIVVVVVVIVAVVGVVVVVIVAVVGVVGVVVVVGRECGYLKDENILAEALSEMNPAFRDQYNKTLNLPLENGTI